ncbi:MAG: TniQ family protein, partial [Proteobacteria bacterium]|nr:TniQ family protein [Pseudomonadota bacterium]
MRGGPDLMGLGWLPMWVPDETLYSWCSRYHQASGNALASTTCAQLFGQARHGYAHDFPVGLDALVEHTAGALGDVDTLIRERTLLPFYLPWRSSPSQRHAVMSLRGSLPGSLKYRLGLLTGRFGANHPLRACDDCRTEDTRHLGMPCWHRVHQCPGVYVCPRHATVLRTARVKTNGVGRFLFYLPEDRYLASPPRFDA